MRSSTTVSLAGSAPARSRTARSFAACDGEAAGDLARAAGDRRLDRAAPRSPRCRARWRAAADILASSPAPKRWAPRMLKRKLTIGSLVRLVEGRLRVDQVVALDDDAALDRDRAGRLASSRSAACRHRPALGLSATKRNSSFAVCAEELLEALRILQARHLDQDAVGALALDVRLGRAERDRRAGG